MTTTARQRRPARRRLACASITRASTGVRIRYAVRDGDPARPPLLIFNGLGANIELAEPFIDALPDRRSSSSTCPAWADRRRRRRPIGQRASRESLRDCSIISATREADVLGVSWGGAIAQQFAFQYRSRCRRLVLAATAPGALMVPGTRRCC